MEKQKEMTIKTLDEVLCKINLGFEHNITEDDGVFEIEFDMHLTPEEAVKIDRAAMYNFIECYNQWDFYRRITIFT
jgi:hypothetical protein